MNPAFVSVAADATVAQALERVRASEFGPQQVSIVCVLDEHSKLVGVLSLAELIRAEGSSRAAAIADSSSPSVAAETDLPEVARVMSDYNLTAIPVLDSDATVIGIIAVDDVLEQLIP